VSADGTDGDAGEAGERAVDGVLAEDGAHDGVVGVGDATANHVGGIDVFDVALDLSLELLAKPSTDVAEFGVTACVRAGGGDKLLARALGEHHDGVSLRVQSVSHVFDDPVRTVGGPINLWNETTVDLSVGERREHGDESALTSHELDHADAAVRALGLYGGRLNSLLRLFHRGIEAESFIQQQNIVINRFLNAHDGHLDASLGSLLTNRVGSRVRPVPADDEHHVDSVVDD